MKNKLFSFFIDIIHIRDGAEGNETIVEAIKENISFRGANFWLLIFAIFIASIGLDINSTAVIIGAMLISPLMGPIVGLGLSLGINDTDLLKRSIKNLLIAVFVGICVSTLYFILSPIDNLQSELLARTNPTIYDVLIALFGGFVGIVSSTRKEKGIAIPGVAIATALMPPLCTAGFGLAQGEPSLFFGALYLFTINSVFICFATLLGIKYLKIPDVEYVSPQKAIRIKRALVAIAIVMILPAVYLAYGFINENNFNQNVRKYVNDIFVSKGYSIIYKNVNYKSAPPTIELAFLSKRFSPEEISDLKSLLAQYGLGAVQLNIKQGNISLTEDQWDTAISQIKDESEKIRAIEAKLVSGFISSDTVTQIFDEAHSINNKIVKMATGNLSFAETPPENDSGVSSDKKNVPVVIFYTVPGIEPLLNKEKNDLILWARTRMQNQDILVHFLPME